MAGTPKEGTGGRAAAGARLIPVANTVVDFTDLVMMFDTLDDRRVRGLRLESTGIDAIVDVHNPLDLTPMSGDDIYEAAIRAVLEDDNVNIGVVGCVPYTG